MNDNHFSRSEYKALRCLWGCINTADIVEESMEKRIRSIPNGWRDLKLVRSILSKLTRAVMDSLPDDKYKLARKELEQCRMEIVVKKDITTAGNTNYLYVPQEPYERILSKVVEHECLFCDKSRHQAMSTCKLYKDLLETYPFDLPKTKECIFQQGNIGGIHADTRDDS